MAKNKYRLPEDAFDAISEQKSWRIRELNRIKLSIKNDNSRAEIRYNIAMLYAHWEGFLREITSIYVQHVSGQNKKICELTDNFAVIKHKIEFDELSQSKDVAKNLIIYKSIKESDHKLFKVSSDFKINADSNLNSKVLRKILTTIGSDISGYSEYFNLIDKELLHRRNCIAHGDYLEINKRDFEKLSDNILMLMTKIQNFVENGIVEKSYLK